MANTYHQLTLHASSSSTLSPNHTPHQFHHLQHCYYPHFLHNQHSHQFFQQQPQHLGLLNSLHPQEQSTTTLSFWKAFNTVLSDAKGSTKRRMRTSRSLKMLVKRVVKQQEVLQNKLVAAIERMEKGRLEWEEGWRRREAEIHDREALMKARERDLAAKRDSSIVSSLEKITGRRFVLVSGKGPTVHQN
ncbi:hypothetical protein ACSQ67_018627 [Phaseolus vulgaris]